MLYSVSHSLALVLIIIIKYMYRLTVIARALISLRKQQKIEFQAAHKFKKCRFQI